MVTMKLLVITSLGEGVSQIFLHQVDPVSSPGSPPVLAAVIIALCNAVVSTVFPCCLAASPLSTKVDCQDDSGIGVKHQCLFQDALLDDDVIRLLYLHRLPEGSPLSSIEAMILCT